MKFWQLNTRRNDACLDIAAFNATKSDVQLLMISDPPWSIKMGRRIEGYRTILPDVEPNEVQTVILLKKDFEAIKIYSSCSRITGVSVSEGHQTITFISVYIRHTSGEGLNETFSLCELLRERGHKRIIIAGDFNARSYRWGPHNINCNRLGTEVANWTDAHAFNILNKYPCPPTFSGENGLRSWIDLTLASDDLIQDCKAWTVHPLEEGLTDHNLVETILDTNQTWDKSKTVNQRNWKEADWTNLTIDARQHLLSEGWLDFDWSSIENASTLNNKIEEFSKSLMTCATKWVPESGRHKPCNAWWNKNIAKQQKKTKKAYRSKEKHLRKHGWIPDILKEEASKEKNTLQKMIREEKRNLWKQFSSSVTEANMWSALKRVASKRSHLDLSFIIDDSGEILSDYEQKRDILTKKFFPANGRARLPEEERALAKNVDFLTRGSPERHPAITEAEVARNVFRGNPFSSPGHDGIPNCLIRHCFCFLKGSLTQMFNRCLELRSHPTSWKESVVIPIPKKNTQSCISNLRPISLLSCLGKILETIMTERISFTLEENSLLDDKQFGFRKQKSVEQGLLRFQRSLEEGLSHSKVIYCCSLDVKSAFDMVSHQILVSRAIEANLPFYAIAWINDFMTNRKAQLVLPEGSEPTSIQGSTPQGSPISPILFDLYFNSVLRIRTDNVEIQGFADDLLVWSSCSSNEQARDAIQQQLETMNSWMTDSALSFNTNKCYLIRFTKESRSQRSEILPVSIGNNTLPIAKEIRYLGIIFDEKLSFQSHIQKTASKCFHKLQELRRLCTRTWGTESDILQKLCSSVIEPAVYFGASIWGTAANRKGQIKPIEQLMRRVGILISGAFSTVSYPSAYWLSGIMPPTAEIGRRLLTQAFQLEAYGLVEEQWTNTQRGSLSTFVSKFDQETKYELRRIKRSGSVEGLPKLTKLIARSIPPWKIDGLPKVWTGEETTEPADINILLAVNRSKQRLVCRLRISPMNLERTVFADPHSSNSLLESSCILDVLRSPELEEHLRTRKPRRLIIISKSQKLFQMLNGITNTYDCVSDIQKFCLERLTEFGTTCFWSNPKFTKTETQFNEILTETRQLGNQPDSNQLRQLHWTSMHRREWTDAAFNSRWREIFDDAPIGRAILDMNVRFQRGRSIITVYPYERREASLLTQFISNHFSSRSYRHRFNLETDNLIENNHDNMNWCECGLGPEDRDHLMFQCTDLDQARRRLQRQLEIRNLTSECWKKIICNPEPFLEFITEVQRTLHRKNRPWGKF